MSKIKDLYAVENNIDDLIPTETLTERIILGIDKNKFKEDLLKMRLVERDEGGLDWIGFDEDVETLCEAEVDMYIRENALDISDAVYWDEVTTVTGLMLGELERWAEESLSELETMVDDEREMNGVC